MASSALKGQSRRINVKRISSLESILEEGASLRQTSSILTLSAIVLQAFIGAGVAGTGLWILFETSKIQEITGNGLRGPTICIVALSAMQVLESIIGIAVFFGRMLCLVISTYALQLSLILCFLITGINVLVERKEIVAEVTLKFNRIDSDVRASLENDFLCDISSWTSDQGSNSTVLMECERTVESWMSLAVIIILGCVGAAIVSLATALAIAVAFHNKHHWKTITTTRNSISPQNLYYESDVVDTFL